MIRWFIDEKLLLKVNNDGVDYYDNKNKKAAAATKDAESSEAAKDEEESSSSHLLRNSCLPIPLIYHNKQQQNIIESC